MLYYMDIIVVLTKPEMTHFSSKIAPTYRIKCKKKNTFLNKLTEFLQAWKHDPAFRIYDLPTKAHAYLHRKRCLWNRLYNGHTLFNSAP